MAWVVKGDYDDISIGVHKNSITFCLKTPHPETGDKWFDVFPADIQSWNILDSTSEVSTASVVGRSIVGNVLAGTAGGIIGGLSAKPKGEYLVLLEYCEKYKSIVRMSDNDFNKFKRMMALSVI